MASNRPIKKWITINGHHVPIYEEGTGESNFKTAFKNKKEIQDMAESHVKKIWEREGGVATKELYDEADKFAEQHNFNKLKTEKAAFAAMNEMQMGAVKYNEENDLTKKEQTGQKGDLSKEEPKTFFGHEFQSKADQYREKFLTNKSDEEIANIKANLDKSTAIVGTTEGDHVAYKAIEDEMNRRSTRYDDGPGTTKADQEYMGVLKRAREEGYRLKNDDEIEADLRATESEAKKYENMSMKDLKALDLESMSYSELKALENNVSERSFKGERGAKALENRIADERVKKYDPNSKFVKVGDKEVSVSKRVGYKELNEASVGTRLEDNNGDVWKKTGDHEVEWHKEGSEDRASAYYLSQSADINSSRFIDDRHTSATSKKSIKVGDKEVGVSKTTGTTPKSFATTSTEKYDGQKAPDFVPRVSGRGNEQVKIGEQEYHTEPLIGGYDRRHKEEYIEGHTYVPHNNLDAKSFFVDNDGGIWSSGSKYLTHNALKEQLLDAGVKASQLSGKSTEDLKKMLLSMFKNGR